MRIAALIVAAGRGSRAGGALPKQYAALGRGTVLSRAVQAFAEQAQIADVRVVIHGDDRALYEASLAPGTRALGPPIIGGATRQQSVLAGLEALAAATPPDIVLIHDAARPFVAPDVIARVIDAARSHGGAIAAEPLADTLKRASADGTIAATLERDGLWRAQTPQGFRFADIYDAHRRAAAAGLTTLTDDAAIAEWAGLPTALVTGSARNVKITTPEDLAMAEYASSGSAPMEARIGSGFDVHRFKAGDHVWLGGVRIAHTHGVDGHSDADVVLHALTDALLGAIADGDIGQHFPPSNARWKGAASHIFVTFARDRVAALGGRIVNVDVTILSEAPKVGPHRAAMQAAIAGMLGIAANRIGIKATTMEQLGALGRGEGLAAMVSASVMVPADA
ncbi:MAG: bifunctional 2-C-methyl-D-erythritol 4-phosphate cytidylyltransferase/2-C-methyl-D-erythritol 2,4-cyclodiphosphate synthase [Hyphomicrobium sp.]